MDTSQVAETAKWFGETKGFWIQTGAFFLSALTAAWALFYNAIQVRQLKKQTANAEKHAKSRATIDIALHEKTDERFLAARKKYGEMREKNINMTVFACGKLTDHEVENDAILLILNNYEFIACGIENDSFDEALYKKMYRGMLIRDYETLLPYIEELKRGKPAAKKAFIEFKHLAEKWIREE